MGKKNKDKKEFRRSPFDYMEGGRIKKLGDRYGVDSSDYNINMGRNDGGHGRTYKGDRDDYEKAVAAAAMRDYDTRRTMEAKAMAGKKKARKYAEEGFGNIRDVIKANNMRERWHKKDGNGGSFSSASDFAGQTMRAVEEEREKQTADYRNEFATIKDMNALRDDLEAQAEVTNTQPAPIQKSDALARAEDRLAEAEGVGASALYENNNRDAATDNPPADAAAGFLYDYKDKVKEQFGPLTNTEKEISNAAKRVQDAYGR